MRHPQSGIAGKPFRLTAQKPAQGGRGVDKSVVRIISAMHNAGMNKRGASILAGILAALASPGSAFSSASYPTLQGSDLDRMRRSACRVGDDFKRVIEREHGKAARKTP